MDNVEELVKWKVTWAGKLRLTASNFQVRIHRASLAGAQNHLERDSADRSMILKSISEAMSVTLCCLC